jgi:hypothetical protein
MARSNAEGSRQQPPDYSVIDPESIEEAVDVYVDAPVVRVDELRLEADRSRADLGVLAEAGRVVRLSAGAAVRLGGVEVEMKGVATQALLEARLDNVTAILTRVAISLDRNPGLLDGARERLGEVGGGARDLLTETRDGRSVRSR